MSEVEKLEVLIVAQTQQFLKEIKKVQGGLGGVQKSTQQGAVGFGKLGGAVFAAEVAMKAITKALSVVSRAIQASARAVSIHSDVNSELVKSTGAVGKELDQLRTVVYRTLGRVPQSVDEVSTAVGELNTRLGITGEALSDISKHFLDFSRVTNTELQPAIRGVTRLMADWDIPLQDTSLLLDKLTLASQDTGVGIEQITNTAVNYGVQLRSLGFNINETIALMGKWEKEGVSTEKMVGGLSIALGRLAQEGINDTGTAFRMLVEGMQDIESTGGAIREAIDLLGMRAGPDFALAVQEGRFEIDDFANSIANAEGTLAESADASLTLSERIAMIGNTIRATLQPVLDVIIMGINKFLIAIQNFIADYGDQIQALVLRVAGALMFIGQVIRTVLASLPFLGKYFRDAGAGAKDLSQATSGLDSVGNAIDGTADSANKAGGAVKELKKELLGLAGFDELNVLSAQVGGQGIGDGFVTPNISIDIEPIDSTPFDDLWGGIQERADVLKERFMGIWEVITTFLSPAFEALNNLVGSTSNVFIRLWQEVLKPMSAWISLNILPLLKEFFENLKEIFTIIKKEMQPVLDAIQPVVDILGIALVESLKVVGQEFDVLFKSYIRPSAKALLNEMVPAVERAIGRIKAFWNILGTLRSIVGSVSNSIVSGFGRVAGAVSSMVATARTRFNDLKSSFLAVFDGLAKSVESTWKSVEIAFKGGINSIIIRINGFIWRFNDMVRRVSSASSGLGGPSFYYNVSEIPHLAQGGVVDGPVLAMMGEQSKREVVLPLERNTGWADQVASLINTSSGNSNKEPVHITLKVGEDTIFDKFIDMINDQNIQTNSSIINI